MPVALNVWQHVDAGSPAADARRLIIASTGRRTSGRPLSRPPNGPRSGTTEPARPQGRRLRRTPPARPSARWCAGMSCRFPPPLVQPQPPARPLPEVVLTPHPHRRAHPREAVHQHAQQRPVPQPNTTVPVSIRSSSARVSVGDRTDVAPFVTTCFGPGPPRPGSTAAPGGPRASPQSDRDDGSRRTTVMRVEDLAMSTRSSRLTPERQRRLVQQQVLRREALVVGHPVGKE